MNGLNISADDVVECPLCMEPLEVDDLNFYPCTCGYQICRFCWHRIRTDENELCPACRKEYPENPADFTPLTQEEMIAFKSQKRQRDQQRKQKITENRKHLANVRVVQKNLVFVVGLPPRLADADILKKHEYFGKYGKIHKVVINPSTTYAGVQGPSASAYVTYVNNSDALRAIQSVNNIMIDGRLIKTSLGTTKYCSHFMKNQQCPKGDCMYLHEQGDPEASFTKEEMHQGKHQEYEKRLHDVLIATSGTTLTSGTSISSPNTNTSIATVTGCYGNGVIKNGDNCKSGNTTPAGASTSSAISTSTSGASQQKDAWPSLSISPVNNKEGLSTNKNRKEKSKHEKSKNEKNSKAKNKLNNNANPNLTNKDNQSIKHSVKDTSSAVFLESTSQEQNSNSHKLKLEKNKDKGLNEKSVTNHNSNREQQVPKGNSAMSADEEVKSIEDLEKQSRNISNQNTISNTTNSAEIVSKNEDMRSLSTSSSISYNSSSNSESISTLSESVSGKSSPGSFSENDPSRLKEEKKNMPHFDDSFTSENTNNLKTVEVKPLSNNNLNCIMIRSTEDISISKEETGKCTNENDSKNISPTVTNELSNSVDSDMLNTSAALCKLNLFDDNNSFFSSTASLSYQQSLLLKNKAISQNQVNNVSSHLPDLLNGIDEYQNNPNANEWEEVLKNVMIRNTKLLEDQAQQEQQFRQQQMQHEEILRMQEIQKRKSLVNNMGMSQLNGPHNDYTNITNSFPDQNRITQGIPVQQQQMLQTNQPSEHAINNPLFQTNMSKFFDFHKNQQQQIHQQFLMSGHSGVNGQLNDSIRVSSFLDSHRLNAQYMDQNNGLLLNPQQQIPKQRLLGKLDTILAQQSQNNLQRQALQQQNQQQNTSRIANQFSSNVSVDDDLGFDPFIETQKALAELMETEVLQHQNANSTHTDTNTTPIAPKILQQPQQQQHFTQQHILDNMQRPRMPPPGFNHMNAFGFGLPRSQNTSKILPFMNVGNNSQPSQHMTNSWNPQLIPLQQQTVNDLQINQMNQSHNGNHNKGFNNNDWTAMDPAILSFRQFSSFPQQPQIPHSQPQDVFIQQLSQQQQQPTGQAPIHGGINLSNNLLNPTSQAQVNFSHSNWLSTEQTLFMNSLANGFGSNNERDKFSISMPPGAN